MPATRKYDWAWLLLGIAVFAQSLLAADGGIPGLLLYWQLKWFGIVFPISTPLLAALLILGPAVVLLSGRRYRLSDRRYRAPVDRRKTAASLARRSVIAAVLFAVAAGLSYWRTLLLPSPAGPARQLSLDDVPATATVGEQHCQIGGVLRREYRVRYVQALTRTRASFRHNFVPITRSDWTPMTPVRFLVDDRDGEGTSGSGLLLRGHLPSYVRRALEQKGLRIASDVMVFSRDPDFGRTAWYVITAFLGIGVFAALVFAFMWWISSQRTENQMERLVARAPAYLLFLAGVTPLVFGIGWSVYKAVHIATAGKADGKVASVVEHGDWDKYSFHVDYTTPEGSFHQYAFTRTPFSKSPGDKITVLYQPGDPQSTEVLVFDTDWFLCLLLFTIGAAFIVPGVIFLRRSNSAAIARKLLI